MSERIRYLCRRKFNRMRIRMKVSEVRERKLDSVINYHFKIYISARKDVRGRGEDSILSTPPFARRLEKSLDILHPSWW